LSHRSEVATHVAEKPRRIVQHWAPPISWTRSESTDEKAIDLKLEAHRGSDGLAAIAADWQTLVDSIPGASLCQMPQYYQSYVTAFAPTEDELVLVTARDTSGRLLAVMPLSVTTRKVFGLSVYVLGFARVPMPVRDIVVDPAAPVDEVVACLLRDAGAILGRRWDYAQFRQVLDGSALLAAGKHVARFSRHVQNIGFSHLLDVAAGQYVERVLNSKARNNLRRNQKKIAELGSFEFSTYATFPGLNGAFESFLDTEAAGWKSVRGGRRAVKLHADQTRFYRDLMERFAAQGRCDIHVLYLNGEAIASDYCIVVGGRCYSCKHGYDERFSGVAPGNLLRAYAVEYYGQSPDVISIDLISGLDWHLTWKPERRKVFDVKFFNRSLRGMALHRLVTSRTPAADAAKS